MHCFCWQFRVLSNRCKKYFLLNNGQFLAFWITPQYRQHYSIPGCKFYRQNYLWQFTCVITYVLKQAAESLKWLWCIFFPQSKRVFVFTSFFCAVTARWVRLFLQHFFSSMSAQGMNKQVEVIDLGEVNFLISTEFIPESYSVCKSQRSLIVTTRPLFLLRFLFVFTLFFIRFFS